MKTYRTIHLTIKKLPHKRIATGLELLRRALGDNCAPVVDGENTRIRSAILKVSATSCVTTTDVAPNTELSSRIRFAVTPRDIGSKPAKGSSYKINSGSKAMARASATRRAIPPEISAGFNSAAPRNPTHSSFNITMSWIMDSDRLVCSRNGKATFSKHVRSVNKAPN